MESFLDASDANHRVSLGPDGPQSLNGDTRRWLHTRTGTAGEAHRPGERGPPTTATSRRSGAALRQVEHRDYGTSTFPGEPFFASSTVSECRNTRGRDVARGESR